jgi:NAD(P)-dependent dehydrogenase (short-subunit alcohol dehydrogenase family)
LRRSTDDCLRRAHSPRHGRGERHRAGVAQHLASLGHRVGLLDRDHTGVHEVADALCAAGGRAIAVRADVSDEPDVDAAMIAVRQEFGEVEILVNNAGFARDSNLVEMPTEDWDAVIVTKMTELGAQRSGRSLADHIEVLRQTVPVGRVGTPDDIARAVAFFAADDADFITGQIIYVSGGPHG